MNNKAIAIALLCAQRDLDSLEVSDFADLPADMQHLGLMIAELKEAQVAKRVVDRFIYNVEKTDIAQAIDKLDKLADSGLGPVMQLIAQMHKFERSFASVCAAGARDMGMVTPEDFDEYLQTEPSAATLRASVASWHMTQKYSRLMRRHILGLELLADPDATMAEFRGLCTDDKSRALFAEFDKAFKA